MIATDVTPSRLVAAQQADKQFTDELPPVINFGLVEYFGCLLYSIGCPDDELWRCKGYDR
ncbi:hypothetical protein [Mycobacterium lepromatosis]|uniref:hypothetical protein n=1 Tax=Mycobacterium lepromatosis TaxID=480418 RepID=UPI000A4738F1|nr:hypothetical protein [Mycobacterium lepromatosis]